MIRSWIALLGVTLALLFPTIASAQGGVVRGRVLNQTAGEPVAGQRLQLHITLPDGSNAPTFEATSGSDGEFLFEGVELEPETQLALCTTYEGAMYHDLFSVSEATTELQRDLAVFSSTTNPEALSMESAHMVFYPHPEEGVVEVMEFLMFQNQSNRTYVGPTEGGEGNPGETLHFTLPEGASNTTLLQGLHDDQVQWHQSGFCSIAPVYPGRQDVIYSYTLPYSGKGALRFVRQLDYHPANLVVMISDNQGQVSGPGVISQGPVEFGDRQYGLYRVSLSPDQTVLQLELSGLPGSGPAAASSRLGRAKVLAGGLAGSALVAGLAYAVVRKRRRQTAPAAASLEEQEEEDYDSDAELE